MASCLFLLVLRPVLRPVLIFGFLLALTLTATCCRLSSATSADPYAWARDNRLVAHATGAVNGSHLTNSPEAFIANYAKGHRLFEVDLLLTSDRKLVAMHDWQTSVEWLRITVPPGATLPLTYAQFKASRILDRYTTMGMEDLARLMKQYPDAYVITDTKITSGPDVTVAFRQIVDTAREVDPAILDRIIPQFYIQPMYFTIKSIYPFKSWIYSIYQSKESLASMVQFVGEQGIGVVTMPDISLTTASFIESLRSQGAYTFVHTINDMNRIRELLARGAFGFYTDDLTPADLRAGTREWVGLK